MPLARHDFMPEDIFKSWKFLLTCLLRGMTSAYRPALLLVFVSTHMPLARHDNILLQIMNCV